MSKLYFSPLAPQSVSIATERLAGCLCQLIDFQKEIINKEKQSLPLLQGSSPQQPLPFPLREPGL